MHDRLSGTASWNGRTYWKTALAGPYPPQLCREMAQLVRRAAFDAGIPRKAIVGSQEEIEVQFRRSHLRLWKATGSARTDVPRLAQLPGNRCRAWPVDAKQWGAVSRFVPVVE